MVLVEVVVVVVGVLVVLVVVVVVLMKLCKGILIGELNSGYLDRLLAVGCIVFKDEGVVNFVLNATWFVSSFLSFTGSEEQTKDGIMIENYFIVK